MTIPRWTPTARELADLELVTSGAWPPGIAFEVALPPDLAGEVDLLDPEGLPLARMDIATSSVQPLAAPQHGPFRRFHRPPEQVRSTAPDATIVVVSRPPTISDVAAVAAITRGTPVLLVAAGPNPHRGVSAPALVRATAAAFPGVELVAAAIAVRDTDAATRAFEEAVALAYGDETLVLDGAGELPAAVREIVDADRPSRDRAGLVVFLTGLSGSGKSTLARALEDVVLERGGRTVTCLDGDVVRHHLSEGLGFTAQDRETNITRIGWVAAEIARHHGLAICSPIAPFDRTRKLVRAMVEDAGGTFALVHVATPLQECERRDRKGLYARARSGEIPEFTGISSPYEVPDDALVRVDTTGRSIGDALADVVSDLIGIGVWERDE